MSKVLDLVFLLECDQDQVYYKNKAHSVCDLCCVIYSRMHATSVKEIWFSGGPPGTEEWFGGTLYNFVIDRLMRALDNSSPKEVMQRLKITAKEQIVTLGSRNAS